MNDIDRNAEVRMVQNSDVWAGWYYGNSLEDPKPAADLLLPFECHFLHNVFDVSEDGSRMVRAGFLQVPARLRGGKIGDKLVRGLGSLSQEHGFSDISVGLASQYSLDIFERVFGRERMTFYGGNMGFVHLKGVTARPPMIRLGATFENARATLVQLESVEGDLEHRRLGFPVSVDLDGLDMSSWVLPREHNQVGVDLESLVAREV